MAEARLLDGLRSHRHGEYEEAMLYFNKATYLNVNMAAIHVAKADVYLAVLDFKSAIVHLRKAITLEEVSQEVHDTLAALLHAEGFHCMNEERYDEAILLFDEALFQNSLLVTIRIHRILCYIAKRQWVVALREVETGMVLSPNDMELVVLKAKLQWKLGLLDRGNACISFVLKRNPQHIECLSFEKGMWSEAREIYERACQSILSKQYTKGIEELSVALQLNPGDSKLLIMRASCYRALVRTF